MTTNPINMSRVLFGGKIHLNNHNFLHHTEEKLNNGDTCGDKFAKCSDLNRHTGSHTGEKRYTCETCDANFSRNSHLTVHIRIHTGEKP